MVFLRNIWFFLNVDLKAIANKEAIELLKNSKELKEKRFEQKASMLVKLNRWAREVEYYEGLEKDLYSMSECLERVYQKIPQKAPVNEEVMGTKPKMTIQKGLSTTM